MALVPCVKRPAGAGGKISFSSLFPSGRGWWNRPCGPHPGPRAKDSFPLRTARRWPGSSYRGVVVRSRNMEPQRTQSLQRDGSGQALVISKQVSGRDRGITAYQITDNGELSPPLKFFPCHPIQSEWSVACLLRQGARFSGGVKFLTCFLSPLD